VVVEDQKQLQQLFQAGKLERDFVAIVRAQGPRANGMPELHKLTPILGVLQDKGYQVALVTDGRMSGASGKVPAAIHVWPEAAAGGPIGKVRDGDMVVVDAQKGELTVEISDEEWSSRQAVIPEVHAHPLSSGRSLFSLFRMNAAHAEAGASVLWAMPSNEPKDSYAKAIV
jgi:phosphogluconate dehydratase